MSQLVKTKRQANFKDFKRFGAFKGLVEQKNVVFNSFVCKLAHSCQKRPNLYFLTNIKIINSAMRWQQNVEQNTDRKKKLHLFHQ
jgi:hypothetical protein